MLRHGVAQQKARTPALFLPLSTNNGCSLEFRDTTVDTNTFSAPIKFVPLSDQVIDGFPRRATNHYNSAIEGTISMCVPRVCKSFAQMTTGWTRGMVVSNQPQ